MFITGDAIQDPRALSSSTAAGQVRQAIDKENKMKQSAPAEGMPSLDSLALTLVLSATQVFEDSCILRDRIHGPLAVDQINRQHPGTTGNIILALRLLDSIRENIAASRNAIATFVLCLFLGGVAFAQKPAAPSPTTPAPTTAAADDNIACSNKVQPTTGFTECELLRLSNYMNQMNAVQSEADRQKQPVASAADDFIGKVVARNAGKQYEAPSKQFPLGRLVPVPPPATATPPPPPYNPPVGPVTTPAPTPAPPAPVAPTPAAAKK